MHILEMVLLAFVKANELKVIRKADGIWLSNGDGFPLNLQTGEIERMDCDAKGILKQNGWM